MKKKKPAHRITKKEARELQAQARLDKAKQRALGLPQGKAQAPAPEPNSLEYIYIDSEINLSNDNPGGGDVSMLHETNPPKSQKTATAPATATNPQDTPPGHHQEHEGEEIDLEGELTPRERLFLEAYFTSGLLDESIKVAGYRAKHQTARLVTARRILEKYSVIMADNKKILRHAGASEAALARMLMDKATSARSETVQLNALKILAQCHGLLRDVVDGLQGAEIRIFTEGREGEDAPKTDQAAPVPPPRPLSITK